MDDAGIKFLDKMYKDLYMSDMVQHTKKPSDSKTEAIRKFLERIDKLLKMADTDSKKSHIVNMLAKQHVIKEENIPSVLPDGYTKEDIIEEQEKSLKSWIDYLSSPGADYPIWTKIWAIQGMLKMGVYDPVKESYSTRTEETINPFVRANPAVIAKSIEAIMKLVNKDEITDEEEARLIKTRSFSKLYTFFEKKHKENMVENSDPNDGIWIKYNQGDKAGAIKLSESVQGTSWCTASQSMAINQVCGPYGDDAPNGGDFYVYYTKDKDGKYTIPRIAIRLIGKTEIGEIRGIVDGQNLELEMTDILESKLMGMNNISKESIDKYLEIVNNLRKITEIAKKCSRGEKLSESELILLYGKQTGFGWEQSPIVKRIISKRNAAEDYNSVIDEETKINIVKLKILPEKFVKDENIIMEILKKQKKHHNYGKDNPYAKYISDELLLNKEFLVKAVSLDTRFLKYAPTDSIDELFPQLQKEIKKDPYIILDMSEEYWESHLNIVKKCLDDDGFLLYKFPREFISRHLDLAINELKSGNGDAYKLIPKEVIASDQNLLKKAIQFGMPLRYLEESEIRKYPKFVINGFKIGWFDIKEVPSDMVVQYPEIAKFALREEGTSIFDVPKEIIASRPELLVTALTSKWWNSHVDPSVKYRLKELEKLDKDGLFMSILQAHPEYIKKAELIRTIKHIRPRNLKASINRLQHIIESTYDLALETENTKTK